MQLALSAGTSEGGESWKKHDGAIAIVAEGCAGMRKSPYPHFPKKTRSRTTPTQTSATCATKSVRLS
ncbi:hypothetical protein SAMN05444392_1136 [Seinonella peptonophila]|uniref:Uncharacterized protein n=1 Tax=Seinonella peptonophila TaxID=112248 RepID=A0A1M5ABS6_9BACL|nr:hypothetical protein SAMN05444392_1136 [Seinonella peptonophila]